MREWQASNAMGAQGHGMKGSTLGGGGVGGLNRKGPNSHGIGRPEVPNVEITRLHLGLWAITIANRLEMDIGASLGSQ